MLEMLLTLRISAQKSTSDLLKHSCGIVVLGCFAASGLGQLPIIDRFCAITGKSTGTFQGVSQKSFDHNSIIIQWN